MCYKTHLFTVIFMVLAFYFLVIFYNCFILCNSISLINIQKIICVIFCEDFAVFNILYSARIMIIITIPVFFFLPAIFSSRLESKYTCCSDIIFTAGWLKNLLNIS